MTPDNSHSWWVVVVVVLVVVVVVVVEVVVVVDGGNDHLITPTLGGWAANPLIVRWSHG